VGGGITALSMSGSSARTGSTTRSMHKPFEGRRYGHFADQEPARLPQGPQRD
jgi:hypothetical protein